jgi:hypothetical protein
MCEIIKAGKKSYCCGLLTLIGTVLAGVLPVGLSGSGSGELLLEQSADMETWTAVELTADMITAEGKIALSELHNPVFFRLDVTAFEQVDPVPEGFVLVEGGTLATSNELNGTVVATFLIGQYEVTWGEWQAVPTPSTPPPTATT